jgi:hypothetical protein
MTQQMARTRKEKDNENCAYDLGILETQNKAFSTKTKLRA